MRLYHSTEPPQIASGHNASEFGLVRMEFRERVESSCRSCSGRA